MKTRTYSDENNKPTLSPREGAELLQRRIEDALAQHGSQVAWAAHLGISKVFVNKVVRGHKPPGPRILTDLRLVSVTVEVSPSVN